MRILRLGLRAQAASTMKIVLLGGLLALSISVFLIVSELSRLSTEDLDQAIASDSGEMGTYVVSVTDDLGMSVVELGATLSGADPMFAADDTELAQVLPAIQSDCPPYSALGEPTMLVLSLVDGTPVTLPFGENLPSGTELCYSGQKVPQSAAYLPTQLEQSVWGPALFIDPAYRDVVALASTDPIQYRIKIITGRVEDDTAAVRSATIAALSEAGARQAIDVEGMVTVVRVDDGQATREASRSVKVVYGAIGWGVLGLGAVAVLVAEMIVVRQRTWFFGLVRALGGRPRHVAALVVVDVLTVVVVGLVSAVALTWATQPVIDQFVSTAFHVRADLLNPQRVPALLGGTLFIVLVAALPPVVRAMREEPIKVIEPAG